MPLPLLPLLKNYLQPPKHGFITITIPSQPSPTTQRISTYFLAISPLIQSPNPHLPKYSYMFSLSIWCLHFNATPLLLAIWCLNLSAGTILIAICHLNLNVTPLLLTIWCLNLNAGTILIAICHLNLNAGIISLSKNATSIVFSYRIVAFYLFIQLLSLLSLQNWTN